jgi:hypothetical protein
MTFPSKPDVTARLLFLFVLCTSFSPSGDEIRWSTERRLNYRDFAGALPASTPWAATTNSSIHFSYEERNRTLQSVTVYSAFDPSRSWMKTKTPDVLRHEQLHFDITEFFARKFYSSAAALLGQSGASAKLKSLFQQLNQECMEMQEAYDNESEHGVNVGRQQEWEKKVMQWLRSTPAYPAAQVKH